MRQAHLSSDVTNFLKQTMQDAQQDGEGQTGYDCESPSLSPSLMVKLMERRTIGRREILARYLCRITHDSIVAVSRSAGSFRCLFIMTYDLRP